MLKFFSNSDPEGKNRKIKKREVIEETNRLVREAVEEAIEQVRKKLVDEGHDRDEIEEIIKRCRPKIQEDAFVLFKQQMELEVERVETESKQEESNSRV